MGARPSRATEVAEETSKGFQEGAKGMKEKAKEMYGRVTGRGEYGTEKYKKYQLPVKTPELNESDYNFFTENANKSKEDIRRIFDKYDLLKENGQVNKTNFIDLYRELNPESADQANEVADQAFHAFDPDNSGYLSYNEFMVTYSLTSRGDMRRKLDYAFDLYDSDHSGYLEKDEVKSVLNGICDLLGAERKNKNPEQVIERSVRDIHFDEKNRVIKEEFINGLMKNEDIRDLMQTYSSTGRQQQQQTSSEQQLKPSSSEQYQQQQASSQQEQQQEPSASLPTV